jgi:hypothetical protein
VRLAIAGISVEVRLNLTARDGDAAVQHYDADALREGDLWLVRGVLEGLVEDSDMRLCILLGCSVTRRSANARSIYPGKIRNPAPAVSKPDKGIRPGSAASRRKIAGGQ